MVSTLTSQLILNRHF